MTLGFFKFRSFMDNGVVTAIVKSDVHFTKPGNLMLSLEKILAKSKFYGRLVI